MLKGIIFDMDGLMFDTESLSTDCFIEAAKKQGYKMTREETHLVIGFRRDSIYKFYEQYFKEKNNGVDGIALVNDQTNHLETVLFTQGPSKMPFLDDLLIYLKKNNYLLAVASSSDLRHIKNNLLKTNTLDFFDVIVSGEEVNKGKPAPDIFLLACEKMGLLPHECLVLEDSKFGIEAAHGAGIKSFMIPDSIKPDVETRKKAYRILNNLKEVINYLEEEYHDKDFSR